MDIDKLSRILRQLVTNEHALAWEQTANKHSYCEQLVGSNHEHPVVSTILADLLNKLLAYRLQSLKKR